MKNQSLTEGIAAVLKFCGDNRVPKTIKHYQEACVAIEKIYSQNNITYYDENLTQRAIQEVKSTLQDSRTTAYPLERYIYRTLYMLQDYYNDRPFKDKYPLRSRYKHKLNPFFEEQAEKFKSTLTQTPLTVPVLYSIARDFFYYLQLYEINDFNSICQDVIYAFLAYEYTDHKGCMGNVMYVTRLLCDDLRGRGYEKAPSALLPFALPPSRKKVLPSFHASEMESILCQPNRTTAAGKRDYAILMLASVTGLRAIDIANLKLTDINWSELTIEIIQHKTQFGLTLPLVQEAAGALADYILHARPDIDLPYIFLTEVMPYQKLSDKSSIANVLNKSTKQSGINKTPYDGKSFHAFRRTMGFWLLNSESSPEMISQVLGHRSKEVLNRYLPLDTASLRICAMGLDEIPVRSEVYR